MTFNSVGYAFFLPIVVAVCWRLRHRAQNVFLVLASYVFYGYWDPRFLLLLWFTTIADFLIAQRIEHAIDDRRRKIWLLGALSIQLGILAYFKYAGFFVDSARIVLSRVGVAADVPTLHVLLPIGVSFYTFQSISYTFDVFRRRVPATRNIVDYALYVAFFPVLVAGPIERARHLLPQVTHPRTKPTLEKIRSATGLILLGLFKKVVLADAMGPIADKAFGMHHPGAPTVAFGAYAFAIQIYADFSGYSDIARGSARLLGFELVKNFEQPYLSRNITEFWRRWHISLSTWLRDYLYVPLGGNRRGQFATYRNLLLTMILGGLWHGAGLPFVMWGAAHGSLLALHRWRTGDTASSVSEGPIRMRDVGRILGTFHLTALAWIFFRSSGWPQAVDLLGGLFRLRGPGLSADDLILVCVALAAMIVVDLFQRHLPTFEAWTSVPRPVRSAAYAAMVLSVIVWSGGSARPFIYFKF